MCKSQLEQKYDIACQMIDDNISDYLSLKQVRAEIQERMSTCGAHIRNRDQVNRAIREARELYQRLKNEIKISSAVDLPEAFRNLDLGLTHLLYLEAIGEYLNRGGKSRGSYLIMDSAGEKPCETSSDEWKFSLTADDAFVNNNILEISLNDQLTVNKYWVDVRPVPQEDSWFENVWNKFMNDEIIR